MSYQSPKGPMKSDVRLLAPVMPIVDGEAGATLDLMKQFPKAVAYGMLLLDDAKHPMAELVRERWSEIHNLSGDSLVLFSLERPGEWSQNYVRYWRNKLGNEFDATWKQWQEDTDPGAAYTYLSLFKPPLSATQLPCLVLFTDVNERRVVVRPIPNWDKDSLFRLLKGIVAVVQESAGKPSEERLAWLEHELTSPGARFLSEAGHLGSRAMDYFKGHPATVISTTISVVLGLSGAGLFTLPAAAVSVIQVLKDTLSSDSKSPSKKS